MRDRRTATPAAPRATPRQQASLRSVNDVAATLDVCPRTVRRLIARGALAVRRIGHSVRVSEDDLRAYLTRCR